MLNVLKQNLNITQGFLTFPIVYKKSLRAFKKSCPKIFFFFYCVFIILKYFYKGKKWKRILTLNPFKWYTNITNICHKEDLHMANEVEILESYVAQLEEEEAATKAEETKVKYKDINLNFIIKYCQEQGPEAVAWLKEVAAKKVDVKVYPRMQQEKDGKTISVADTTQEPKVEERNITFIQLKKKFVEKFMPDIMPKSKKKESMYDIIAAL